MPKEMFISSSPHETRVAVCEDDFLVELYIERDTDVGLVGGLYKGRVNRVLPGMQSAFVDIGLERDAFLYVSDFSLQGEEFEGVLEELEGRSPIAIAAPSPATPVAATESGGNDSVTASPSGAETPPLEESAPARPTPSLEVRGSSLNSESATSSQNATPSVSTPAVSSTPSEGLEFRSLRHHRGRRRRGHRVFGERRLPQRSEGGIPTQQRTPSDSSQPTFEILPGESLAKYSHTSSLPADDPGIPVTAESVPPHRDDLPEKPLTAPLDSYPVEDRESPRRVVSPMTPAEEASDRSSALPLSAEGAENSEKEEEAGQLQKSDIAGSVAGNAGSDTAQEKRDALEGPAAEAAEPDAPERAMVSESSGVQGEPHLESGPSVEREYTLREPHQRPHFAPRRRRGRRSFRNGRRPEDRQTPSRSSNNQPLKISELLKEGQEILVQIAKEPLGTKGARITSHIALPGRYLVYMPTITHIGVSRKIASEQERLRLRNIILDHRGSLTGGFIVRTAAEGRSEEEIKADLAFLTALWNETRAKAERTKAPALIYRDLDLVQRVLRDTLTPDFKCIRVDNETEYERVVEFVSKTQPALLPNVKLHTRETPLFEDAGISVEIEKALRPKVWLKSGGYIVINQTEALVAIDVNTGKYVGKTNRLEDTILKTNIDAVKEIVRQIRLRDLGGIIVVDFIDMDERRNRNRVVQALEEALRSDRAPTKVLSFNEFGLVALTRKRVKQSLQRTLCEPCDYCNGGGWVKSPVTVSYEVLAETRKMASSLEGNVLTVRAHPEVAKHLKARNGVLISEMENIAHKDVVVKSDPSMHQEQFEIS